MLSTRTLFCLPVFVGFLSIAQPALAYVKSAKAGATANLNLVIATVP